MVLKKDVLSALYSDELFNCLHSKLLFKQCASEMFQKAFSLYKERFQPKSTHQILEEMKEEFDDNSNEELERDDPFDFRITKLKRTEKLWRSVEDNFVSFTYLYLKLHPFCPEQPHIDVVFREFEKLYYAYQRYLISKGM